MNTILFHPLGKFYKFFYFFKVFFMASCFVGFGFRVHAKWLNLRNGFRHIIRPKSASQNNRNSYRFNYFLAYTLIMCFSRCSYLGISFLLSIEKQVISNSIVLLRQLHASLVSYWDTSHNFEIWKLFFQSLYVIRRKRFGSCPQMQNIRISFIYDFNYIF